MWDPLETPDPPFGGAENRLGLDPFISDPKLAIATKIVSAALGAVAVASTRAAS